MVVLIPAGLHAAAHLSSGAVFLHKATDIHVLHNLFKTVWRTCENTFSTRLAVVVRKQCTGGSQPNRSASEGVSIPAALFKDSL